MKRIFRQLSAISSIVTALSTFGLFAIAAITLPNIQQGLVVQRKEVDIARLQIKRDELTRENSVLTEQREILQKEIERLELNFATQQAISWQLACTTVARQASHEAHKDTLIKINIENIRRGERYSIAQGALPMPDTTAASNLEWLVSKDSGIDILNLPAIRRGSGLLLNAERDRFANLLNKFIADHHEELSKDVWEENTLDEFWTNLERSITDPNRQQRYIPETSELDSSYSDYSHLLVKFVNDCLLQTPASKRSHEPP